jgi:hypothetical protein
MVNFGIQKKLGERAGSLSLVVRDIFDSFNWKIRTEVEGRDFVTNNVFDFSQRTFSITYSRSFGNTALKASRERQTGSDAEKRRVN